MGKELNAVEININVDLVSNLAEQHPVELNDLSLALVGGGAVSVSF